MSWSGYEARDYVDFDEVESFCRELAEEHPEWVVLEIVGHSRHDRPLLLLTVGARNGPSDAPERGRRPALWLDAGTHAAEWTGVSAVLFAVSRWIDRLTGGDEDLRAWFRRHDALVMPCISPDGYQAMHDGAPYLRSTLRPPGEGTVRSGLDPKDMDGDGRVRTMRWKHPAGPFVEDPEWEPFLRPRRVDDDPEDAYFVCDEGKFINWDGVEWTSADAEYGLDLNRNFPGQWEPFEMFGMDAGSYPLSEPESRSVVDAFAEHPHIACGLTMHTYSGAVLTQPYREDSSLDEPDIELMELLAEQLAEGTGWDVYRSYPDFAYDEDQPIVGVWADTMTTVFGVPGYTIELWDPFEYWDVDVDDALDFSFDPDLDKVREMLDKLAEDDRVADWTSVDHPQLGDVEIGGLEYLRTIRNPPAEALAEECERAWTAVERTRRSLPSVETRLEVEPAGDRRYELQLILENTGFLPTSGISRGKALEPTPEIAASASLEGDGEVLDRTDREFDHLAGWGQLRTGPGRHPIYARLPKTSQRDHATWTVEGEGTVDIDWIAGRAGRGTVTVDLDDE